MTTERRRSSLGTRRRLSFPLMPRRSGAAGPPRRRHTVSRIRPRQVRAQDQHDAQEQLQQDVVDQDDELMLEGVVDQALRRQLRRP